MISYILFCNKLLHEAELIFRENRKAFFKKSKMDKELLDFIMKDFNAKYTLPCHFKNVLRKFLIGRIYFWKDHMNRHGREINAQSVEEASNASKSVRQLYLVQ